MIQAKPPVVLLVSLCLVLALTACHKHTPGAEATCTQAQVCTECGKVLAKALGHEPSQEEPTCDHPRTCMRCGEVVASVPHTPGAEATCTQAQICTVCGETVTPAKGHTPGAEASCTEPQKCTVCGEVLVQAKGHQVNSSGVCTVCARQIAQPNQRYNAANGGGAASGATGEIVPENRNSGHYHNTISSYYNSSGTILICGDYCMEYFLPDSDGYSGYAGAINSFAAKYPHVNVTSVIVPKCCAFESPADRTDPYEATKAAIANTYAKMDGRVKKADAFGVMSQHAGEYMFYRTDHHWTSLGAYYTSVAYCNANGITPYALDSYKTVINTGWYGSLYYWADSPAVLATNPDYTVGHFPHTGYLMSYYSGGEWYGGSAINPDADSYGSMFICGDQPLTVFDTDVKNGKRVIVFKESYGNAFVPYLLDYYERVVVVDIRKDTDSVASLMSRYQITDAVIINNLQAVPGFTGTVRDKVMS